MSYERKVDYLVNLNNFHNEMMSKFKRTNNRTKATRLEQILRNIKRFNRKMELLSEKGIVENALNEQYQVLLEEINSMLQIERHHRGIQSQRLFYRAHGGYGMTRFKNADDIFEQEFASLVAAVSKLATNQNSSASNFLIGTDSASSAALNEALNRKMENTITTIINNIAEVTGSKYSAEGLEVRQGKPDVKGLSADLEVSQKLPSEINDLVNILQGHTFSLKNYNSYRKNVETGNMEFKDLTELDLNFGHTNLYKAATGALDEVGASTQDAIAFFFRGGNHIQQRYQHRYSKNWYTEETQIHWAHMRLVYELRGSGLLNQSGKSAIADFIIWNDPGTENIAVRATDDLIYSMLTNNSTRKGLFGEIKMSANYFMNS